MDLHTGFCGSTLLATVLDQPARALVLSEPHLLAALAEQAKGFPSVQTVLWQALGLLHRPLTAGEQVVRKPTNWFNNLVPLLAAAPTTVLPCSCRRSHAIT